MTIYRYAGLHHGALEFKADHFGAGGPSGIFPGLSKHNHFSFYDVCTKRKYYEVYKEPMLPCWYLKRNLLCDENIYLNLSDFFSFGPNFFVSQKAKKIIERVDPGWVQFVPVEVEVKGEIRFGDYFSLHARRVLKFMECNQDNNDVDFSLFTDSNEKNMVNCIVGNPQCRNEVERYPIWKMSDGLADNVVFFNETLKNAFDTECVSGLIEFTCHGGNDSKMETLAHI